MLGEVAAVILVLAAIGSAVGIAREAQRSQVRPERRPLDLPLGKGVSYARWCEVRAERAKEVK